MRKLIHLTVILSIITRLTSAQELQIRLLNPDGTPATDAKVVAVLAMPGGIVEQDLKPRQMPNVEKQPLKELVNDNGTVTPGRRQSTRCIQRTGFLFLPASAFGETAKLREWAHVELDVSSIPEEKRVDIRLSVLWSNNIQGTYFRPRYDDFHDTFTTADDRFTSTENKFTDDDETSNTEPDWRFEQMIAWKKHCPMATQSMRVPPGEIMISIESASTPNDLLELPPGSSTANIGLWRVPGGVSTQIVLPKGGSFEGKLQERADIPDWGQSNLDSATIVLDSSYPFSDSDFRTFLQPSGSFDQYAAKLNSDEGFEARRSRSVRATSTTKGGLFRFDFVPIITYTVGKRVRIGVPPYGPQNHGFQFKAFAISSEKPSMPVKVQIRANETLKVDLADVEILIRQPAAIDPPRIAPDLEQPSTPATDPTSKLTPGAQIAYKEITHVVDGKEVTQVVPFVVYPQKTPLNDQTMTPSERPANGEVEFFQPENDRYFGPAVPPTPDSKPDAATTLIQNWLRTAKDPSDQTELRKLLQDHLQQEFEANQKSRQAEIERLQQLLVKSKEWLDQRQQRREEIIKKRIDELLQQQALPKAEASGGR